MSKELVQQLTHERDRILLSNMRDNTSCHRTALGGGFKPTRYRVKAPQAAHSQRNQSASKGAKSGPIRSAVAGQSRVRQKVRCQDAQDEWVEAFRESQRSVTAGNSTTARQQASPLPLTCRPMSAEDPAATRSWNSSELQLPADKRPSSAGCCAPAPLRPFSASERRPVTASWHIPVRPRSALDSRSRLASEERSKIHTQSRPGSTQVMFSVGRPYSASFCARNQPRSAQPPPAQDARSGNPAPASQARVAHSAPVHRTHIKAPKRMAEAASPLDAAAVHMDPGELKDFHPSYTLKFALGMVRRTEAGCSGGGSQRVLQQCVSIYVSDRHATKLLQRWMHHVQCVQVVPSKRSSTSAKG